MHRRKQTSLRRTSYRRSPKHSRVKWKRLSVPILIVPHSLVEPDGASAPGRTSGSKFAKISSKHHTAIQTDSSGSSVTATFCRSTSSLAVKELPERSVELRSPSDGGAWYGTGFLVGPRLLLTNHHVIANADEASQCEAEFGYESDIDGVVREPVRFNLRPHEIFYTNSELDVTFVAVTPLSDEGVPLHRYGRLPLIPLSGKAISGEWVTIIQHPGSEPKQIAIRASQIITLEPKVALGIDPDKFIHYSTDTEPGSSGAPVFNDQWQVLALHHKAVPAPTKPGTTAEESAKQVWIANEGVRISAIFNLLERKRFTDLQAGLVLDKLDTSLGLTPLSQGVAVGEALLEADRTPLPVTRWAGVSGYDATFLSERIDLGAIYAPVLAKGEVAPLLDGSGHELTYHHFSTVIHADRKFPLITAVNIDGDRLIHPGKRKDTWRRDARIADQYQPAGNFYEKEQGIRPRSVQPAVIRCGCSIHVGALSGKRLRVWRNPDAAPKIPSTTQTRRRRFKPTTTPTGAI